MKNLKKLGKVLGKKEQMSVNGGINGRIGRFNRDGSLGDGPSGALIGGGGTLPEGDGTSPLCTGQSAGHIIAINGSTAECTGNGDWYYNL